MFSHQLLTRGGRAYRIYGGGPTFHLQQVFNLSPVAPQCLWQRDTHCRLLCLPEPHWDEGPARSAPYRTCQNATPGDEVRVRTPHRAALIQLGGNSTIMCRPTWRPAHSGTDREPLQGNRSFSDHGSLFSNGGPYLRKVWPQKGDKHPLFAERFAQG